MRIDCLHGYFKFTEVKAGEVSFFQSRFGLELVLHKDGYFTFPFLIDAPKYSIEGSTYLGAEATETFEGQPWEVMQKNSLVYNFVTDEVVLAQSISTNLLLLESNFYFVSTGLILPGSLTNSGKRVVSYSAFYLRDFAKFKYSGVKYV